MLDWDTLRLVSAVADEGSISGTARKLGINVATVSRQIGRLETALDTKLFDRRHNGLFPTPQGLEAIRVARSIEREIEGLVVRVDGSSKADEGQIRLSVPLNVMGYGFSSDILEFQNQYPKINFVLNATDEPADFESREADVVVRVGENPPASLWGFKIARVGVSFYGSKDFMSKWRKQIEKNSGTAKIPFIELYTANQAADREEFLSKFPNGYTCAACNGMDSLIPMVRQGLGAGRMMRYMAAAYPDLEKIFDCDEKWSRTVWILTHRDYRSVRRIRKFMEFIRDRFKDREGEFNVDHGNIGSVKDHSRS